MPETPRPIVAIRQESRWLHVLVVRDSGNPDSQRLLIDARCNTYRRYASSCQPVLEIDTHERAILEAAAKSKVGRQAIAAVGHAPTVVIRRGRQVATHRDLPPSPGRGSLPCYQPPMFLADGFEPGPGHELVRYLDLAPAYRRELDWLREHRPHHYEAYLRNVHEGQRFADIGRVLGVSEATARQYKRRAVTHLRARRAFEGGW